MDQYCFWFLTTLFMCAQPIRAQQWVRLGSPIGSADIRAFCNEGDTVYAGGQSLLRSTDGGETWSPARTGIASNTTVLGLEALNGVIFAATTTGVYRSTNHGENWSPANNGLGANPSARSLTKAGERLFAGIALQGLYYSTDLGTSWTQPGSGPIGVTVTGLWSRGDTVFVGGGNNNRVYVSPDLGQTWWDTTVTPNSATEIRGFAMSDSFLFTTTAGYGVYKSSDGGRTWNTTNTGFQGSVFWTRPILAFGSTVITGFSDPRGGVWRSSNNGAQWEYAGGVHMTRDAAFNPYPLYYQIYGLLLRNNTLFAGTFGYGVFASTDLGGSWRQITSPLNNYILTVLVQSGDTLFAGGEDAVGLFLSTDNGGTWAQYTTNLHGSIKTIHNLGVTLFVGGLYGSGIARSTDGGRTWAPSNTGLGSTNIHRITSQGTALYAATEGGLYTSTNAGTQWTLTGWTAQCISLFARGSMLLCSRTGGYTARSTDGGATWDTVGNGMPLNFIAQSFSQQGTLIYAGGGGGGMAVLRSTDDGATWTNVSGPMTFAREFASSGDTLFVTAQSGTTGAVYFTTNSGTSWSSIPNASVGVAHRGIIVRNGYVYVCGGPPTFTGVWRRQISGTVSVRRDDGEQPEVITLLQNYPNPFNPSTNIRFSIPAGTQHVVSLRVYDVLGREVATLVNEVKEPGEYNVEWDAGGTASGVYLYRLQAGEFSTTRKLLLLR